MKIKNTGTVNLKVIFYTCQNCFQNLWVASVNKYYGHESLVYIYTLMKIKKMFASENEGCFPLTLPHWWH